MKMAGNEHDFAVSMTLYDPLSSTIKEREKGCHEERI
jgi:hypothetical protein